MSRNKKRDNGSFQKKVNDFEARVSDLQKKGYAPVVPSGTSMDELRKDKRIDEFLSGFRVMSVPTKGNGFSASRESGTVERTQLCGCDGMRRGGLMSTDANMLDYSQDIFVPTPDEVGTPGLGYVPWGQFDDMPVRIFEDSASMAYTAQGLQYLADTVTGLGPRFMYHIARWCGGTVTCELVHYEDGGIYIREKIREILRKLSDLETPEETEGAVGEIAAQLLGAGKGGCRERLRKSYEQELHEWDEEYQSWKDTLEKWQEFERENNVEQHYQACMAEDVRLDMYFPTVNISKGRYGSWEPEIVKIGHLDASCCRLEQLANDNKSHYTYYSHSFRTKHININSEGKIVALNASEVKAFPNADCRSNLSDIKNYCAKNKRTPINKRETWWACPQYYPTPTKHIYSQPAWWSMFPTQLFQYASTLVYDKAIAKKNGVRWGTILYINVSYLTQIFQQMGIENDTKEQQKVRDAIYLQVQDFVSNRNNSGQLMVMDSYMSADEKNMIRSIELVDVPQPSQSESDSALKIATSAVFFALGIHPGLIGADPGWTGNSGTFQRELHLLKTAQLSPRQRRYLNFINGVARFNKWNKNGGYVIRQATLTTLDNSKTGMVEESKE